MKWSWIGEDVRAYRPCGWADTSIDCDRRHRHSCGGCCGDGTYAIEPTYDTLAEMTAAEAHLYT